MKTEIQLHNVFAIKDSRVKTAKRKEEEAQDINLKLEVKTTRVVKAEVIRAELVRIKIIKANLIKTEVIRAKVIKAEVSNVKTSSKLRVPAEN